MTETLGNGASNGYQSRRASVAPHSNGKASYAELHKVADHFIGGNRIEKAPESKVKDFVASNDGHTVITNVSTFKLSRRATHCSSRHPGCSDTVTMTRLLIRTHLLGSNCQQRYRRRQRNSFCSKMGLRDVRRRARHSIYRHGYPRRFASQRRLHPHGGSLRGSPRWHK